MAGGLGNDTYFVYNTNDVVTELAGQGNDTVVAWSDYTLVAGLEVETLQANTHETVNLKLTGNDLSHSIIGGVGSDTLTGGAGSDTLTGNAGNDRLVGNAGDDVLNGGTGVDTMLGGLGNDTYFVDNAADVVTENAGEGTDTVNVTLTSFNLGTSGANVENLTFIGSATARTGTGNVLDNVITGGAGVDTLNGGLGNDTLIGGAGGDNLTGGGGNDVFAYLATGFGTDTITDFTAHGGAAAERDLIDLSALGITAGTFASSVTFAGFNAGTGTKITVNVGGAAAGTILVNNVRTTAFDITDFKLA
jgi:Ca2+-binding RTX toxin-like protein